MKNENEKNDEKTTEVSRIMGTKFSPCFMEGTELIFNVAQIRAALAGVLATDFVRITNNNDGTLTLEKIDASGKVKAF